MCIVDRTVNAFAHWHFNATLIVVHQLMCAMVPDNVHGRLQSAFDYTPQYNGAACFHIPIGVAHQFGAGYCVAEKKNDKIYVMLYREIHFEESHIQPPNVHVMCAI